MKLDIYDLDLYKEPDEQKQHLGHSHKKLKKFKKYADKTAKQIN